MKCPFCGSDEDRVIDSRAADEGSAIRRRRECVACERRFTTYERIEETLPAVVKKDGRREVFDRLKVQKGLERACEKRPVSAQQLDDLVTQVQRMVSESGEREVASRRVGELVMERLRELDEVAYVRFASVYREFRDISEFMQELTDLVSKGKR